MSCANGAPAARYRKGRLPRDLALYAVTDSQWLGGRALEDVVEQAIEGGATFVQLREKAVSHERRVELARRVLAVCRARGVPFVVDDDVACALEVGADGVHVGQSDMACAQARALLGPDAIVGVSAQTPEHARRAKADGADYLGVGAVFSTGTKPDADDVGIDGLEAVCAATGLPVVAIGGISAHNAAQLARTGACGVAVVSALFAVADPSAAARELRAIVDGWPGAGGVRKVLTIAGSDSSGGAGIQADLKTIAAHLLYGESVVTALTAQNTCGVRGILDVPPAFVGDQIDAVFEDVRPDAVKVGMVSSAAIARAVADGLARHGAANVVVDPVMVATSGADLMAAGTAAALVDALFPLADVVTPNIPEASALCGFDAGARRVASMAEAARCIARLTPAAVLVKGGHLDGEKAVDVLVLPGCDEPVVLEAPRVATANTHGTGCTLSSAIACGLASGLGVEQAVRQAKSYLHDCLAAGLDIGAGSGPVDHMARLRGCLPARGGQMSACGGAPASEERRP